MVFYDPHMIFFDWSGTLAKTGTRDIFVSRKTTCAEKRKVLMPHAVEMLKHLRRLNYRMGIISNTQIPRDQMEYGLRVSRLSQYFDYQSYSSDPEMCSKPCHKIFRDALNDNHLNAHEAVYVGNDYQNDVLGPSELGIPTIFIGSQPSGPIQPNFVIHSLQEVVKSIHQLSHQCSDEKTD